MSAYVPTMLCAVAWSIPASGATAPNRFERVLMICSVRITDHWRQVQRERGRALRCGQRDNWLVVGHRGGVRRRLRLLDVSDGFCRLLDLRRGLRFVQVQNVFGHGALLYAPRRIRSSTLSLWGSISLGWPGLAKGDSTLPLGLAELRLISPIGAAVARLQEGLVPPRDRRPRRRVRVLGAQGRDAVVVPQTTMIFRRTPSASAYFPTI